MVQIHLNGRYNFNGIIFYYFYYFVLVIVSIVMQYDYVVFYRMIWNDLLIPKVKESMRINKDVK